MPEDNVQTPRVDKPAEAAEPPVTVVVDTHGLKEDLTKELTEMVEKVMDAKALERAESKGASHVDEAVRARDELAERIKTCTKKEQWMVTIPGATTKELTGHLRDFCQVTEIIQGKPGDTVNH